MITILSSCLRRFAKQQLFLHCSFISNLGILGSHANRRRTIDAMERDAYAAVGWNVGSDSKEPRKPTARRERKNIWCMDSQPSSPVEPSSARRPQTLTAMQEALEKIRRGGDRKIIYVG